jgi:hypothetical protein
MDQQTAVVITLWGGLGVIIFLLIILYWLLSNMLKLLRDIQSKLYEWHHEWVRLNKERLADSWDARGYGKNPYNPYRK